jgi:hypothetical protein
MLLKNVEVQVFKIDNDTFEPIGGINHLTSLIWPDKFNGYATFELNAPVTPENKLLLKKDNILWCGGDNAAKIEIISFDTNENGEKVFKVKGRTLEQILTTRIIWGTYNCTSKHSSTAMYEIVNSQCVNPSDSLRKIPFLECAEDEQLGKVVSFQKTGGEVYDAIESIAKDADLGFDILFKPKEKKLIFKVVQGKDRTIFPLIDDGANFVIFSTEFNDILSSSYYTNNQDVKTLAYVAGEGEGSERNHIVSGNAASTGFARKELYVDARDVQSEIKNEDGSSTTINRDDYNDLLNDRGIEKLAACSLIETFEAKMRVVGNIQYIYGIDYFKGDKVIVQDEELGIQIIATITEVYENFDDEYELEIVFGYSYPTLIQKIKQRIIN